MAGNYGQGRGAPRHVVIPIGRTSAGPFSMCNGIYTSRDDGGTKKIWKIESSAADVGVQVTKSEAVRMIKRMENEISALDHQISELQAQRADAIEVRDNFQSLHDDADE